MISVVLTFLPAFILGGIFLLLNKENLTYKKCLYLILIMIVGAIGSYICYRLEMHFGSYFKKVKDSTYLEVLFYAFFGVAIFEEGYKLVLPLLITLKEKISNGMDILLFCVFSSIGFALFENVVFFGTLSNSNVAFSRMLSAFPSHVCNAIWMGYFLWLYSKSNGIKRYICLVLSFVIPTLLHAIYNSFLYGGVTSFQNIHFRYCIVLFISSILLTGYIKIKNKC